MVFVFIEILFKILLFKGGVLIYAEHCVYIYIYIYTVGTESIQTPLKFSLFVILQAFAKIILVHFFPH